MEVEKENEPTRAEVDAVKLKLEGKVNKNGNKRLEESWKKSME